MRRPMRLIPLVRSIPLLLALAFVATTAHAQAVFRSVMPDGKVVYGDKPAPGAKEAKQVNLASMDGRARLAALARPHLQKLREGPLRSLILDELSRITRLSRQDIETAVVTADESHNTVRNSSSQRLESGAARPVKRALQLLLERPNMAENVDHLELLMQSEAPGVALLIEAIDFFHAHPEAHVAQLLEFWRETPKGKALERLLQQEVNVDEAVLQQEFNETLAHLCQKGRRVRVQQLLTEARLRPLTAVETREIETLTRELAVRGPA